MNSKIIGFTISVAPIDHRDVDLFATGLTFDHLDQAGYHIYLWGIGDLSSMRQDQTISLSFPLTFSLADRNVCLKLDTNLITIENDWLGSIPVFYNLRTRTVSTLVTKLTNWQDQTVHPEGLANYLDFGFSVFEQTPLKNIKFMPPFSQLTLTPYGLALQKKTDQFWPWLDQKTSPQEALAAIKAYIRDREKKVTGSIIIPTSGGFDSRLLNLMVEDKARIRSFTYGVSLKQSESAEVVKARALSERLKTYWRQIELTDAARYWPEWFSLFGGSVHLHGMYHIEFFKRIRAVLPIGSGNLLSGIIGDGWSGLVQIPPITSLKDVEQLAYAHGITVDSAYARIPQIMTLRQAYLDQAGELLTNPAVRVIASMRLKLILLNYLMNLPDYFGFPSWSPFLNQEIVAKMLTLPASERKDRLWQRRFFADWGVDLESQALTFTMENTSDVNLLWQNPIPALRSKILASYLRPGLLWRVNWAYRRLVSAKTTNYHLTNRLLKTRLIGSLLKSLGVKPKDYLEPYNQLIVLKSLELALAKARQPVQ